jgi:hypothetical protein
MRSIRAITATIVAVCISFRVSSLSAYIIVYVSEAMRAVSLHRVVESAVVVDLSATENQEFET